MTIDASDGGGSHVTVRHGRMAALAIYCDMSTHYGKAGAQMDIVNIEHRPTCRAVTPRAVQAHFRFVHIGVTACALAFGQRKIAHVMAAETILSRMATFKIEVCATMVILYISKGGGCVARLAVVLQLFVR